MAEGKRYRYYIVMKDKFYTDLDSWYDSADPFPDLLISVGGAESVYHFDSTNEIWVSENAKDFPFEASTSAIPPYACFNATDSTDPETLLLDYIKKA